MAKVGEVYNEALKIAKEYDISGADIRRLIAHDEGFREQIDVIFNREKEMTSENMFYAQLEELKEGKPVEYVMHEASFLTNKLYVDERVLIPRGETEELVANITERIRDYFDPRNYLVVADIGTGSGAISLALKEYFPNWLISAVDISKDALDVAKINFQNYHVDIETLQGDALEPFIQKGQKLDVIVSNPPYILDPKDAQESVRKYEPATALWLDKNNSVYEKIFANAERVKKHALFIALEISPDLEGYLTNLMKKYLRHYEYEFVNDLNGMKRFLFVFLGEENEDA